MKRNMKSVITVLLALVMTLCMAQSAFAASITVNEEVTSPNTYTAYKVMTSTKEADSDLYTYVVEDAFKGFFENGANGYTIDANNEIYNAAGTKVVTEGGLTENTKSTEAAKLAAALEAYVIANPSITGTAIQSGANSGDIGTGFFLVRETASAAENAVASKPILVDLREDTTITPKDSSIPLEKKIVEGGELKDENEAGIGDTVHYQITSAVPTYSTIQNLDESTLTYHLKDKLSDGLTFTQGTIVVKIGDEDVTSSVSITYDGTEDDKAYTWMLSLTPAQIVNFEGKKVIVTFDAVLNENARVNHADGNPNEVDLKYTNNPNEANSFDTKHDEVKTFTYGFQIHKVDKAAPSENLKDAKFTVQVDSVEEKTKDTYIIFAYDSATDTYTEIGTTTATTLDEAKEEAAAKGGTVEITSVEARKVTVKGVEDGTYKLTETQAPDDYTKLSAPIIVSVEAVKDATSGDDTGAAKISANGAGNAQIEDKDGKHTGAVETATDGTIELAVYVENAKGITLPETGATSAMFCMIGGIAILLLAGLYYEFAVRRAKDVK